MPTRQRLRRIPWPLTTMLRDVSSITSEATSNTLDMWPLEPSEAGLLGGVVVAVIVPKVAVGGRLQEWMVTS